jgi:hypothetical protein
MKSSVALIMGLFFSVMTFAQHSHENQIELKFEKSGVHAQVRWLKGPIVSEESKLLVEWKTISAQKATNPGSFKVSISMPEMDHGSAPTQIEQAVDKQGKAILGLYKVNEIYFTMGGHWEVKIAIKQADGSVESQTFSIHLPGGHHH